MRWLRRRRPEAGAKPVSRPPPATLRSARLHYRPLTQADQAALHALWTLPQVRRFLWDDRLLSEEQTRDLLAQNERLAAETGSGLWAALDEAGQLIGFCGFGHFRSAHELELLYAVHPDHWMRGYAREMVATLMDYGFEALALDEIRASVDAPNRASQRVLERLGFVIDRDRGGDAGKRYYRLPRPRVDASADWEAA